MGACTADYVIRFHQKAAGSRNLRAFLSSCLGARARSSEVFNLLNPHPCPVTYYLPPLRYTARILANKPSTFESAGWRALAAFGQSASWVFSRCLEQEAGQGCGAAGFVVLIPGQGSADCPPIAPRMSHGQFN